jgi:hypothetical protein
VTSCVIASVAGGGDGGARKGVAMFISSSPQFYA